jgi:hypothetical protein
MLEMLIKKIAIAFFTTVLAVCSFTVSAKGEVGSGPNPFRDCGIGAALFASTSWAAVSSNVIWDVGTTAVTSATASPETCSGESVQAAQFILDTYDNLVEETAKGRGEHLTAVINILGCGATMHKETIHAVRGDMARSVASPSYVNQSPVEKASDYYNAVSSAVATHCSA